MVLSPHKRLKALLLFCVNMNTPEIHFHKDYVHVPEDIVVSVGTVDLYESLTGLYKSRADLAIFESSFC